MVPALLGHLDSRHDRFRESALDVLAQVFQRAHRRDEPVGNEDHVVARLLTTAMEDPTPEVRVAAVRALQSYGRADVVPALRQMAVDDPSQDVRYQATVSVYRLSREPGTLTH
jgi:HEAT repeat protein